MREYRDPPNTILKVVHGSRMYGTDTPNSDMDIKGVCIEPRRAVLGLGAFEQFLWQSADEGERSGPEDVDVTIYGLKKFLNLACKGNPSVLEMLFAPDYVHLDPTGESLVNLREAIVSYQCKGRFLGYLHGQRLRALNSKPSGKGRREGREPKWAMHMVRLGHEAVSILSTGRLVLPLPPGQVAECLDVREGRRSFEWALGRAEELEQEASEITLEKSALPKKPDVATIEEWMSRVYRSHYFD